MLNKQTLDKQTPKIQTTEQRRWVNQWLDSARIIADANSTADGLFCHYLEDKTVWRYEICLRLIVTACDDLDRNPIDGYFAKLLGRSSISVAVMTTPQSSKERTDQTRSQRQKRPRLTETTSANRNDSMPIEDNINVIPRQKRLGSVNEQPSHSPASKRRHLVRGLRPSPSMTSATAMFSNALVSRNRSREPSGISSEADESLEYAPRIEAIRSVSHARRRLANPDVSLVTASWQECGIMELMQENVGLQNQLKNLQTELESMTAKREEALQERDALMLEIGVLNDDVEGHKKEKSRALEEVTELKDKLDAIDKIMRKTS